LTYGKIEDDDPIPQDETEVGDTDHDELGEALQVLADNALLKGASMEFVVKLRELLITYHNSFRLHLGQDPPADVRPLKIELKPDANPKRIPTRKYAPPQASKPNEVIYFDYLYMGPSVDDAKYVLIVKDDYSNYVWLKQCKNADADSTAAVFIEWFAAFGVAQQWVLDQGSHFKNTVMADIQNQLGTNHHFTTAYSPWANGTVEAVCKQTIRAARAMLSEMHFAPQ
jgi:transposase InsO family protein